MMTTQEVAIRALQAKYNLSIGEATKILPVELTDEEKEELRNIKDLYKRPEQLKIVLSHILELEYSGAQPSYEAWKARLIERLCWQSHFSRSISRVLSELAKRHLIIEWHGDRDKHIGYYVDTKGLAILGLYKMPEKPQEVLPDIVIVPEEIVDIGQMLEANSERFLELASIGKKIKENRAQHAEFLKYVENIEAEYEQLLDKVKGNPEFASILKSLNL